MVKYAKIKQGHPVEVSEIEKCLQDKKDVGEFIQFDQNNGGAEESKDSEEDTWHRISEEDVNKLIQQKWSLIQFNERGKCEEVEPDHFPVTTKSLSKAKAKEEEDHEGLWTHQQTKTTGSDIGQSMPDNGSLCVKRATPGRPRSLALLSQSFTAVIEGTIDSSKKDLRKEKLDSLCGPAEIILKEHNDNTHYKVEEGSISYIGNRTSLDENGIRYMIAHSVKEFQLDPIIIAGGTHEQQITAIKEALKQGFTDISVIQPTDRDGLNDHYSNIVKLAEHVKTNFRDYESCLDAIDRQQPLRTLHQKVHQSCEGDLKKQYAELTGIAEIAKQQAPVSDVSFLRNKLMEEIRTNLVNPPLAKIQQETSLKRTPKPADKEDQAAVDVGELTTNIEGAKVKVKLALAKTKEVIETAERLPPVIEEILQTEILVAEDIEEQMRKGATAVKEAKAELEAAKAELEAAKAVKTAEPHTKEAVKNVEILVERAEREIKEVEKLEKDVESKIKNVEAVVKEAKADMQRPTTLLPNTNTSPGYTTHNEPEDESSESEDEYSESEGEYSESEGEWSESEDEWSEPEDEYSDNEPDSFEDDPRPG